MITLEYEAANEKLSPLISSFYRFEYTGAPLSELERADRAQFRFYLCGQGEYHFSKSRVDPGYPVTIVGPTTAPCLTKTMGDVLVFGWGITPAGWAGLMGTRAEKKIDHAFDAREIFGDWIMDLRKQLAKCGSLAEQVSLAEAAISEMYVNIGNAPFEFTYHVDQWLSKSADPQVDDLLMITGLSIRQLERTTKRYYGMPPKKLARKYRALRAAHALALGDSLDENELGSAFYDQSHLIREIKQFTGLTPGQLRTGQSTLTRVTMEGRSSLAGKVNPLISDS
ncbi:MAG: AraC family transcriptional regulator [Sphingomonadales bacterium]|nr:AraC family transcriptional regulator [Sphingomonadales bacterium]